MDVILGIDIGGTGIKGAPVNIQTGEMIGERFRIKTPRPATPQAMVETVAQVAAHFSWKGPIGCGFPAVVKNGVVMTAGNIDQSWIGTDGKALIEAATGCPVALVNDADAAGLAEIEFGVAKGRPGTVIMVTLGTGIGTAMFLEGRLFPNTELGHLILRGKDAERRAANSAREKHEWSWKKFGRNVTEYLNELDRLLWPDLFVIGGGASNEWDKLQPHVNTRAEILPARMANIAGIVGAALAPLHLGMVSRPEPVVQAASLAEPEAAQSEAASNEEAEPSSPPESEAEVPKPARPRVRARKTTGGSTQ
ncbi:MAG: ROK family protein [Blastocatellia bacterium]|nr:ROK family protein [Blastocatellia bacterium]